MNVTGIYKYMPEDYKEILNMYEEMTDFYKLLEKYLLIKTESNRFFLEKQLNDLLFTIKHRELEGNLTHTKAADIREYIRELVYD